MAGVALLLVAGLAMTRGCGGEPPDRSVCADGGTEEDAEACRLADAAPPAVPPSPDPLPGPDGRAWRQLLERRTPLHFPAAAPDGQPLSRLQTSVESWSWEHIAEGLGAHVQGFRGPPGEYAFPYYEGNMPLEGVRASHTLRRSAEPGMYSGAELVRGIREPPTGGRLLYASQSLIRLKPDGSPDERALARGPMPPIGAELTDAVREMASGWPEGRMGSASLWLGHAGSVTPLHFDTNHNVYVQLHGAKRVQLLPPSAATRAHLYPSLHPGYRQALLDISRPALARSGEGKRAAAARVLAEQAQTVVLRPGDALTIPPYWLHSIEALGPSDGGAAGVASVACWFSAAEFLASRSITPCTSGPLLHSSKRASQE